MNIIWYENWIFEKKKSKHEGLLELELSVGHKQIVQNGTNEIGQISHQFIKT